MPDASRLVDETAIMRADWCRQRAAEHRKVAKSVRAYGGWSWADWLDSAAKFDAQADEIIAAMERGEAAPLFSTTPFKG